MPDQCVAVLPAAITANSRTKTVCGKKYEDEDGTMYRSFEAFCHAQAAHRMATQFSKAIPATLAK